MLVVIRFESVKELKQTINCTFFYLLEKVIL